MSEARQDSWSGKWVKEKLEDSDFKKVECIKYLSSNMLNIIRDDGVQIKVATMSLSSISEKDLTELLNNDNVDFVINISKEPYITRDALIFADNKGFGLGGLGDLMRVIALDNPNEYINPEVKFISRGLSQHNKVSSIERLDNRRYKINRPGLGSVVIVALNDYDLTADSVRSAMSTFTEFQAVFTSNPNCKVSKHALEAAKYTNIKIYNWSELLGALNKVWN